jgi:hypothetical protein
VNWNLLTLTLGWKTTCAATLFGRNRISSLQRIARVEQALAHGHPTTTGIIDDLTRIEHRDAHMPSGTGADTPSNRTATAHASQRALDDA